MKKLYSLLTIVFMTIAAVTVTSCDPDEEMAHNLWGVWQGNMYMQSSYNGRVYQSSYSVLAFDKDPYAYAQGTGYWIDYYSNAPFDNYSSRIQWRVVNGELQIYSIKEQRTYYIYNYTMNGRYFSGYIDDGGSSSGVYFELQKTSSPNWSDYDWNGYDYNDYYYGYNYAPARVAAKDVAAEPVRSVCKNEKTK